MSFRSRVNSAPSDFDKFELKNEKKAIYRDYSKTILTFGNAEFEICHKANSK